MATTDLARGDFEPALTLSLGTETANVRLLTITGGRPGAEYKAAAHKPDMTLDATAYHLGLKAGTGGAQVTTTDKATLVFTLDADGGAVLEVTDVATGSNATAQVMLEPVGFSGPVQRQACPFDAS